jgi:2-iminobutanoate/2-iminopropanoate deaminase
VSPRQVLHPEGVAPSPHPYSHVVVSGDLVFTSGQTPFDAERRLVEGGFEVQARQALDNLGRCLATAGCGFDDVLKTTVFLESLSDFSTWNAIYRSYFAEPYPARSTVQVGLNGFLVEIEAVARRPGA